MKRRQRQKVEVVIEEASFRATIDRPEAKEALHSLAGLILEAFVNTLTVEEHEWLATTPEGKRAFRESWPAIVDAYFKGLSQPR